MGLGVTRESVGDILVAEQSVDVLVTEPVRRFLLDSWDSAGRVRLKVQPIGPTELQVPEEKVKLRGIPCPPCGWTVFCRWAFP